MTRIPYADPQTRSEATGRALAAVPPLNVFRLLAHADTAFPPFLRLTAALWNEAELTPRRRELVILRVARLTGAEYEWHQHVLVARMCEVTEAEIAALDSGAVDELGADERTLIAMTDVIVSRERAGDELLAAARSLLGAELLDRSSGSPRLGD